MEKTLIWWGCWCGGGLCDRLLGLTTSYCIARELGRRFLIKWDDARTLEVRENYDFYKNSVSYQEVILNNKESQEFFLTTNKVDSLSNVQNILIWSNQNLFYYFCENRPEIRYEEKLLSGFQTLFTEILYPKPCRSLPFFEYIGIHIRTVDDAKEKLKQVPYITRILKECKNHIEKQDVKNIFISSDCSLAYELAERIFGQKYTVLWHPGEIVHSGKSQDEKGLEKVFSDLFSLVNCKIFYFGWNSNFSKVACLLKPEKELYSYEHPSSQIIKSCSVLEVGNYFSNPFWR